MALTPGTRLGPYEIVGPLGAGGMGEVYRAHDTRLGRDVAIKSLPDAFSSDPDRLARFEREAKVLASLNHPNVAGIYGVEDADGHRYLALEYVEGETLAARLARGVLPLEEAIEICLQIATGMEAAHESGIVHRDLKPGNVMMTPGDQVKVVDFGLAKGKVVERDAISPESPTMTESPALPHSPTIGTPATLPGVILGTAAYLSPEQARGKAVDRRTDIWSFGCVLYECLTGRRAFEGETVSDLIARILQNDVDWSRLPKGTPQPLQSLMQRCLEKDPRKRLRDMGDARLALEEIREGKGASQAAPAQRLLSARVSATAFVFSLLGAAAGIALWNGVGPGHWASSALRGVRRATLEIPSEIQATTGSITPDGRFLIVLGRPRQKEGAQASSLRIYRRRIDSFRFEAIEGTEGFNSARLAPDGRWQYFTMPITEGSADLHLMRTLLDGSATSVTVTDWDPSWDPTSWVPLSSGDVLVGTRGGGAYVRVPASGATPSRPVKFDVPGFRGAIRMSKVLPRDRAVLLNTLSYEGGRYLRGVGVLDLASGKTKILLRDGRGAEYSPTGHLVFARRSTLLAVSFDLRSLATQGEPVAIAQGIRDGTDVGLSEDGTLSYWPGGVWGERRHVIVANERGDVSDWTRDGAAHDGAPVASPDGKRIAYSTYNAKFIDEIWISEHGGASKRRVVAMKGADCYGPVWSPDGKRIAFARRASDREDGVYVQSVEGGAPTRICGSPDPLRVIFPTSWSPDGKHLLANISGEGGNDIVRIATSSAGDSLPIPVPLLSGPADQAWAYFSPDGRWVAYESNESGESEVYIAPFLPDGSLGAPTLVGRGSGPGWSRTGHTLFFVQDLKIAQRNRIVSISLRHQPLLSASAPVQRWDLDSLRDAGVGWDILPGDQLVLVQKGEDEAEAEFTQLACVFNFFDELKRKVREAGKR